MERAETAGRLVLAAGVAAALPVLVAIVYAVVDGWVAFGDDAYITTLAFDVFTDRSPLVGQRSSGASGVLDETAYSPRGGRGRGGLRHTDAPLPAAGRRPRDPPLGRRGDRRRAGLLERAAVADRLTERYAEGPYRQDVRIDVDAPPAPGRLLTRIRFRDPLVELDAVRTVSVTMQPSSRLR